MTRITSDDVLVVLVWRIDDMEPSTGVRAEGDVGCIPRALLPLPLLVVRLEPAGGWRHTHVHHRAELLVSKPWRA